MGARSLHILVLGLPRLHVGCLATSSEWGPAAGLLPWWGGAGGLQRKTVFQVLQEKPEEMTPGAVGDLALQATWGVAEDGKDVMDSGVASLQAECGVGGLEGRVGPRGGLCPPCEGLDFMVSWAPSTGVK